MNECYLYYYYYHYCYHDCRHYRSCITGHPVAGIVCIQLFFYSFQYEVMYILCFHMTIGEGGRWLHHRVNHPINKDFT